MSRRNTLALSKRAGACLLDAWLFAEQVGTPLNAFLTVHMAKLDGGGDPLHRQGRWRERMAKWLAANRIKPTFLWWREQGSSIGEHYHMLLFVPRRHLSAFKRMVERNWVQDGEPGAIDGPKRATGEESMIGYALKDLTRKDWLALNLSPRLWSRYSNRRSRRPIVGKRCGTSESIGRAARVRYYGALGIPLSKAA